jgi:hypothetical protein
MDGQAQPVQRHATSGAARPDATTHAEVPMTAIPPIVREDSRPPSWPCVLLAPWRGVWNLPEAARTLARASWSARLAAQFLCALSIVPPVVALMMAEELLAHPYTGAVRWTPDGPVPETDLTPRTVGSVWRGWHAAGPIGTAELALIACVVNVALASAIAAWLLLPTAHVGGGWSDTARCAGAGVVALGGWAWLGVVVCGSVVLLVQHAIDQWDPMGGFLGFFVTAMTMVWSGLLLLYGMGRGVAAARAVSADAPTNPLCDGCGYDLTHRPESGRCPECDYSVDLSLTPGHKRVELAWERGRTVASWCVASADVIRTPTRFYDTLRVHGGEGAARRFQFVHLMVIGGCAYVWLVFTMLDEDAAAQMLAFLPILLATLVVAAGWATHRAIAALMTAWWLLRGTCPPGDAVRKVLAYETAYLWTFCLFNGCFITSLILFDHWLTDLIGRGIVTRYGVPPEVPLFFFGNIALLVGWLGRWSRAVRRVQWSNF